MRQGICQGIDDSTVIVVCLIRKYLRKVRDGSDLGQDNYLFEYNYATYREIPKTRLVALVMEHSYCLQLANWSGPVVGPVLGVRLQKIITSCTSFILHLKIIAFQIQVSQ